MKPVRLPAAATVALPRWGIIALCLLYILPGLIGRDPWKGDDAAGFGIMWTMAHGNLSDWLWPHIVGLPMPEEGPLAFWLGAICIKLFGWLVGEPMAARLSTGVSFLLGSLSVWYATYLLGRRPEAQPLKLAFGGQPEARDFGRTLADGALLIYLGCLGLLLRSHETSAEALQISLIACTLYLCVRLLDEPAKLTAAKIGGILGLLVLTRGWVLPLALWISLLAVCAYRQQRQPLKYLINTTLPLAIVVAGIWLFTISLVHPYDSSPYQSWMLWNYRQFNFPKFDSISYLFRYGIWFSWPAWPFAAWAIFAWRKQEKAMHISLPVSFLICFGVLAVLNHQSEEAILLPILPPLAILAAFGLPTMKRSAINAVDWFSVIVFTAVAAFIWLYWLADQTGWPPGLAKKPGNLVPGYQSSFNIFVFIIALAATVAWFRLVYWRISRQPAVLWRAVVLSSGGVILCWLLVQSLGLPWLDQKVSYAPLSKELAQKVPPNMGCIQAHIGPSQRASFAYFGKLQFAGFSDHDCQLLLVQNSKKSLHESVLPPEYKQEHWSVIWSGHRAADNDELFTLYQRKQQ
ncbi:ArnT family glycosyltransferase [Undibacterium pigrum]|uniref:4-amino-4-deoxy-L-arabinose transferase-like glycosyltransferase n=1 Tax=Undibacterium pigrum TaxID=401470 RepID=A0A318J048_9BURK|nr:glycosyltransferase [Undibacterium pigrum]PXX40031.1 4-amino-4-deoxy-L-arabinose transferase-like glycosyltransferase [Undibacterium pigrum]